MKGARNFGVTFLLLLAGAAVAVMLSVGEPSRLLRVVAVFAAYVIGGAVGAYWAITEGCDDSMDKTKATDEEFQRVRETECGLAGHRFEVLEEYGLDGPAAVQCTNCGQSWPVGGSSAEKLLAYLRVRIAARQDELANVADGRAHAGLVREIRTLEAAQRVLGDDAIEEEAQ